MIRIDEIDLELTIPEFIGMIAKAAGIMAGILAGLQAFKWILGILY